MKRINETIKKIKDLDFGLMAKAKERLDNLTKPKESLGKLEDLARLIVGITASENPSMKNKVIFTFAADHGVTEESISAFPKEVTAQMVYNFLSGGAGINVLANHIGARVVVADLGVSCDLKPHKNLLIKKVNYGTKNFTKGPAMSRNEAIRSICAGIDIFEQEYSATLMQSTGGSASGGKKGIDIIGTGEMGIGNTTASSAIAAVFTKKPLKLLTGRGTGIDEKGLKNKIKVIEKGLRTNKPDSGDAIDVLSKVGGFEIGGLSGIILGAAARKVPVVIDGFISAAAALIAFGLQPKVKDYIIASHLSVEKGHKIVLGYIGLKPLFDLDLRLGEGTGAALGINLAEASVKILTEMATFKNAKVSEKNNI
ncbi:MAG: nicotinate-nucleotide--dimethylbenzimidazole phosphoribosyltransferase [Candidatus Omnitrophica bacterium]|jgi:nicotinate-nucleotide--dimethylbenzimidazole phosphoribosyltransferase|nr:nicotinate-nucleotide--dimethylbenzimidazole phosphoribosyltransferase [Candidatus Omnitrophota bacterium]